MRAVAHSAALPDQARYAAAEAAFAEAKAYLSSREAQQMSESDLERVLHRLGQELMHKLLQGHRDQRSSGEAAGPVEGADDVERSQRRVHERHLETTVGTVQVARRGGSRSSTAPRRSSTSRAPPPTAPTSRWYSTSSTWPSTSGRRRMCSIARGALELALGLDGLQRILEGKASKVAAAMRRAATVADLSSDTPKPVDTCADYLLQYAPYLHYDRHLAAGCPIATGVEGACRYLVRDRMELTGVRWRLVGAAAVLKLRALRASRDFVAY